METESGYEPVSIHYIEGGGLGTGGWGQSAGERVGFEERDAFEAPGGIGQFFDEGGFGWSGRAVFVVKLAAVFFICGRIFGRENGGAAGQAVAECVQG